MLNRIVLLIAGIAVIGLSACNSKEKAGGEGGGETIKIGHFASLTGPQATFGTETDEGVKLAVEEINAAGGVLGKKIELITEDTQSKTDATIQAVEKLIGRDEVVALIGEVASGRSLAAAPVAQREKVPMVSHASTNEDVTVDKATGKTLDYIFRICFIDPFQGKVMAKFARENLKVDKVAILTDKASAYSVGLAKAFRETFTAMGGTIVEEQAYQSGDQDFKAQFTGIKAKNPQAIFIPGYYSEMGLVAQQARGLGLTVPLLGGDGWDSPTLTEGLSKQALEGSYFSNHYSAQDTSPRVKDFIARFSKKYNKAPGAMAALGYDVMKIIAEVIKTGGKADRESIRKGLASLANYPGVTGNITIDAQHNATKPAVVLQIRDGKFEYHSTIAP
jgi:branched-chain amino acid transport system substrate-binding protein